MRKRSVAIIALIVVLGIAVLVGGSLISFYFENGGDPGVINEDISAPETFFPSKEECEEKSGRECALGMCDYQCEPGGYGKGWFPVNQSQ